MKMRIPKNWLRTVLLKEMMKVELEVMVLK